MEVILCDSAELYKTAKEKEPLRVIDKTPEQIKLPNMLIN
jgi:hypothetical protein